MHGSEGKSGSASPHPTLASTGEFATIDAIVRRLPMGDAVVLGPGDDAAVVTAPDGRVVVSTDVLVDGVHFRSDWSAPDDIGHRAAAASLADVAAMGATCTALVVGLAAPADLPLAFTLRLADGLRDEAALVGASVVGGDVVRSDVLTVAVTALGDLAGRDPVTRSGARPGDVVAVCGRLGWAQAGLTVLRRGFGSPRVLVAAHRRPEPPYAAAVAAAEAGATSMIDISDGLVADLRHVAVASSVRITLETAALVPDAPLVEIASAFGADPLEWVLGGGDDHAFVATFPQRSPLPDGFRIIGAVQAAQDSPDVVVDGAPWAGHSGHVHFGPR